MKLDYPKALGLLKDLVAERGEDFVYENPRDIAGEPGGCDYWHTDRPGCLIGQALHRLGVPGEWLSKLEGNHAGDVLIQATNDFDWEIETPVRWLYREAQRLQDERSEWGFAVKRAEEYVARKKEESK